MLLPMKAMRSRKRREEAKMQTVRQAMYQLIKSKRLGAAGASSAEHSSGVREA